VPIGTSCSTSEYGDPFTIMGSATTRHHNNWHRAQFGWLTDAQTVSAAGIYSLAPAEIAGASPKLLRIARGDGTYLNLEFRQPSATFDTFSSTDPAVTGVSVRIAPGISTIVQSKLIDANPATTTFADAPFGSGQAFTDPVSGVTVTTVSVSPGGASVSVQFDSQDTAVPTAPSGLSASVKRLRVDLRWGASSDNVGVAGYRVLRDGVQIAQVTALSYRDNPGRGIFVYTLVGFDAAGNVSPSSNAFTARL